MNVVDAFLQAFTLVLRLAPRGVHSLVDRDDFAAVYDVERVLHLLPLQMNLDQSF